MPDAFRLFVIIAVSWSIVGTLAGAAISPQRILAGIFWVLQPSTRGKAGR